MNNFTKKLVISSVILFTLVLLSPTKVSAAVTGIKAYNAPRGGQPFFQVDVYVSSQEDYPDCTYVADFTQDGTPNDTGAFMPSTSLIIKPTGGSDAATITITCEGKTARVSYPGNNFPYDGEATKKVGTPEPVATKVPAKTATPLPTATLQATATPIPTLAPTATPVPPKKGGISGFFSAIGNFFSSLFGGKKK